MLCALLPLKDFVNAKQRLAGVLAPHERRCLFQAMVEDVLDELSGHPQIDRLLIVSDDPSAKLLAEHYSVDWWPESELGTSGLNEVVEASAKRLATQGVDSLLVIHGDLPLVRQQAVSNLLETHRQQRLPAVTLAPDRHGSGSNALLLSPPNAIRFAYGHNSCGAHRQLAKEQGASFEVLPLACIACDIDQADDLRLLLEQCRPGTQTYQYLHSSDIANRILAMFDGAGSETAEPSILGLLNND
jgi:2-phospho-L-lactate guanylyltransferase